MRKGVALGGVLDSYLKAMKFELRGRAYAFGYHPRFEYLLAENGRSERTQTIPNQDCDRHILRPCKFQHFGSVWGVPDRRFRDAKANRHINLARVCVFVDGRDARMAVQNLLTLKCDDVISLSILGKHGSDACLAMSSHREGVKECLV